MKNKKIWSVILPILVVFGVCVLGCFSTPSANYFNLGDVSEENCALIQVSPIGEPIDANNFRFIKSDYSYRRWVKIDGEDQYGSARKTIVRVTPGVHTFTITFYLAEDDDYFYLVPVDIKYDCKAGKGYQFSFSVQEQDWLFGNKLGHVITTTQIDERYVNENGSFGKSTSTSIEEKKEELFLNYLGSESKSGEVTKGVAVGRDFGRVVKVSKR